MKIKIFSTLGPSSLNKNFLKFCKNKVYSFRLNLSHIQIKNLSKVIKFVKKNSKTPICIDTEGAQIRTKLKKKIFVEKNKIYQIFRKKNKFNLYPETVYEKLRNGDILDIGFKGLRLKVEKISKNSIKLSTMNPGILENNKGVHVVNRKIKLNYLTDKDFKAIKIAQKMKIKYFALSFTNSEKDIIKFNKLLPKEGKIYKIETLSAVKYIDKMFKFGNEFLIDRADLSKGISIEKIPAIQKKILTKARKKGKNIYIATNFLESMVQNFVPAVNEANDIFHVIPGQLA